MLGEQWCSVCGLRRRRFVIRSFANDLPDGITVSNYLNLDMAGVNYPGDYALSVYLGLDGTGDVIDQPGMYYLAEWIGADALNLGYEMERGREAARKW